MPAPAVTIDDTVAYRMSGASLAQHELQDQYIRCIELNHDVLIFGLHDLLKRASSHNGYWAVIFRWGFLSHSEAISLQQGCCCIGTHKLPRSSRTSEPRP